MKRGRKSLPCPDVDLLRSMFDAGHAVTAIAKALGKSGKAVDRWLVEFGLGRPKARFVDLEGEIWKPVRGWDGFYEVSNMGRVRSMDRITKSGTRSVRVRGRIMKPYPDRKGRHAYSIITLHRGGRKGTPGAILAFPLVHKLVLEAFVGPRPKGMEACHDNGDGRDNRLSNLRWDTHRANMEDQFRHGTKNRRKPREIKWRPGSRGRRPKNWQAISI